MSYETQDISVQDSVPIECFRFTGPFSTWLYNDSDEIITISGQDYRPLSGISRGTIEVGVSVGNPGVTTVTVPFDCEVAIEHGYLSSPSFLTCEIFRVERGTNYDTDNRKIWFGRAKAFSIQGLLLDISTQLVISGARQVPLLSAYWQRTCNFDLYDADTCKINKSLFTATSTVTVIGSAAITVVDDGFPDHTLAIGTVVNTRTGEERLISDNLANVINIAYGFTDIVVGDTVNIIRGCKHNSDDCINTYNNILNYGGQKYIPRSTPFGT